MTSQDKNYDELKVELKEAKDDLKDAQERITRIEKIIWGRDPQSMTPDPDAMIHIMRDIRSKMPDLEKIQSDYNFKAKLKFMLWGNAGLVAVVTSIWAFVKFLMPSLVG